MIEKREAVAAPEASGTTTSQPSSAPAPTGTGPSAAGNAAQTVTQAVSTVPGLLTPTKKGQVGLLKTRPGAGQYIAEMAALSEGDPRFASLDVNPQQMVAEVQTVSDMTPLVVALKTATDEVAFTIASKLADAWKQTLAIYALAQVLAKNDAVLAQAIAGMSLFLSPKKAAKKTETQTDGAATVAAAPVAPAPTTVTTVTTPIAPVASLAARREGEERRRHARA